MKKQLTALFAFSLLVSINSFSQSTYTLVYNLFQAHCTTGCHTGATPDGQLDLSGSPSVVYNNIVNKNPVNTVALGKGDKLIDPGYPHGSFLLRKCNNGLDPDNGLDSSEGVLMPQPSSPMSNKDIELIRQWILFGALQTGNQVDTALINKYYSGRGINSPATPFPAPTEPGAFQIHVGKIFVPSSNEYQFYLKQDPRLPDTVEVYRIDALLGRGGHHFNLLKFNPGAASSFADGFRDILGTSHLSATVVGAFQESYDLELPEGTAYLWEGGIVLDINFHIVNSNRDSILAIDLYLNVYTQPKGTAQDIMNIKWYSNFTFSIPHDNAPHTFTAEGVEANNKKVWYIWMISSHTHKYGSDFDIFYRNHDGSEGDLLYEGYYNSEYNLNQGYYDWQHPPREYFEPFIPVKPEDGFIYKTTYKNTDGPSMVYWGATAADEMMIMYVHYVEKDSLIGTVIHDENENPLRVNIFPNPAKDRCEMSYALSGNSKVSLEILNSMGEKISVISSGEYQTTGSYIQNFNLPTVPGFYFARLTANYDVQVKPFIVE